MTRSICTTCGLRSQRCQCRREASTTGNANAEDGERAFKLTRVSFCVIYLVLNLAIIGGFLILDWIVIIPDFQKICHLEVFVDSFAVSNASNVNATADLNIGFMARCSGKGCKASFHTIKSSLLRGDKLISESYTPDYFGLLVTGKIYEPFLYAGFKTVAIPEGVGGGVVWDHRVEVVFNLRMKSPSYGQDGFVTVTCGNTPVKFTVDPAGNVKGSLLGNMRPCEYLFRNKYKDISF